MKKIRRLAVFALAVLMIMALAVPALAATTYTITIEKEGDGRIYNAYQIFTGDITGTEVTHIEWGSGVTTDGQAALKAHFGLPSTDTAQDVARKIATSADAEAVAKLLKSNAGYLQNPSVNFTYDSGNGVYTLDGQTAGYYLIVENTVVEGEEDSRSAYMMELVKDVTITPKDSVPTLEKTVSDINDSTQMTPDTHLKGADYDIGDSVPFHIHITLDENIDAYKATGYKMVITDTMSKGLTFDSTVTPVVKYGTHVLDASCYVISTPVTAADGTSSFTVTFDNLFDMKDTATGAPVAPHGGGNLIVDYNAVLNEDAVIGSLGNPNEAYLKFSNDPNGDGEGQTPVSVAIVFTYQLDVNKVDQDNQPLTGADFTLYKNDVNGNWNLIEVTTINAEKTEFSFKGLDDGTYKLVESKVPTGYNKIQDMVFEIKATHDSTLITLNGEKVSGIIDLTTELDASSKISGVLSTTVVNERGAVLPSTGGVGTTIFYIVGGVLVVAAAVLLVTRKRMSFEK